MMDMGKKLSTVTDAIFAKDGMVTGISVNWNWGTAIIQGLFHTNMDFKGRLFV